MHDRAYPARHVAASRGLAENCTPSQRISTNWESLRDNRLGLMRTNSKWTTTRCSRDPSASCNQEQHTRSVFVSVAVTHVLSIFLLALLYRATGSMLSTKQFCGRPTLWCCYACALEALIRWKTSLFSLGAPKRIHALSLTGLVHSAPAKLPSSGPGLLCGSAHVMCQTPQACGEGRRDRCNHWSRGLLVHVALGRLQGQRGSTGHRKLESVAAFDYRL